MSVLPTSKVFLQIGPFQVTWYALCILTGAFLAYWLSQRTMKRWKYATEILEDYLFPMLLCGIVGARLYYVLFQWSYYRQYPSDIIAVWKGGLAIHGGLIAGVLFSYVYFKRKKISFLRMFDCIMPNVLMAQALGRWGNFANQEAFGNIVAESYFDHFPSFIKKQMYISGAYRQPTFLYESALNILGFFLITMLYRKKWMKRQGDAGFAYMIWYGCVRFFVEGFRTDSLMLGPLKIAQVISLAAILFGILGMLGIWHKVFHWYKKPIILCEKEMDINMTVDGKASTTEEILDFCKKKGRDNVVYLTETEQGVQRAKELALYSISTNPDLHACQTVTEYTDTIFDQPRTWNDLKIW